MNKRLLFVTLIALPLVGCSKKEHGNVHHIKAKDMIQKAIAVDYETYLNKFTIEYSQAEAGDSLMRETAAISVEESFCWDETFASSDDEVTIDSTKVAYVEETTFTLRIKLKEDVYDSSYTYDTKELADEEFLSYVDANPIFQFPTMLPKIAGNILEMLDKAASNTFEVGENIENFTCDYICTSYQLRQLDVTIYLEGDKVFDEEPERNYHKSEKYSILIKDGLLIGFSQTIIDNDGRLDMNLLVDWGHAEKKIIELVEE